MKNIDDFNILYFSLQEGNCEVLIYCPLICNFFICSQEQQRAATRKQDSGARRRGTDSVGVAMSASHPGSEYFQISVAPMAQQLLQAGDSGEQGPAKKTPKGVLDAKSFEIRPWLHPASTHTASTLLCCLGLNIIYAFPRGVLDKDPGQLVLQRTQSRLSKPNPE